MRRVSAPADHIAVIGAGASVLVGELLGDGYTDVTAVDISQAALDKLASELGTGASRVEFRCADVRHGAFDRPVVVWHDRATFHFLIDPVDQAAYVGAASAAVRSGGHLVLATFAVGGPEQCSGLPTRQYSPEGLSAVFGDAFELVESAHHVHVTPSGSEQRFLHSLLRRTEC